MKKSQQFLNRWDGDYRERGISAENAFFGAWKSAKNYSSLVVNVRKATAQEDFCEKTDAVMMLEGPKKEKIKIRVQIKAHYIGIKTRNELLIIGVAPLTVSPNDSEEDIRFNTMKSTKMLLDYLCDGILPLGKTKKRDNKKRKKRN